MNLNRYYACLLGGDNNPTCTGYTPQPAASYGYLADQANGMLAGGLKVDGALTLLSLNSLMEQTRRTGRGVVTHVSPALIGTPLAQGIGGSFARTTTMDWVEVAGERTPKGYERDYIYTAVDVWCWVPGGGSTGGQISQNRRVPKIDHLPTNGLEYGPSAYNDFYEVLEDFVNNQECVDAYLQVGIDIVELLTGRGIRIGPMRLATYPGTDFGKRLGLTPEGLKHFLDGSAKGQPGFTIWERKHLVDNSLPTILVGGKAYVNGRKIYSKVLAHEIIHAGGIKGRQLSRLEKMLETIGGPDSWPNDLSWMGVELAHILNKCTGHMQ